MVSKQAEYWVFSPLELNPKLGLKDPKLEPWQCLQQTLLASAEHSKV